MGNAPSQNEISDKVHRQFLRQSHSIPIIKKKTSINNKRKATTAAIYPNRRTSLPPSPTPSDPLPPRSNSHDNIMIKGRRYQNVNSKYMLPNDEQEQDRLVQVHFIYKLIFGNNFTAPVRDLLSGSTVPNQIRKNSNGSSSDWILDDVTPPRILDVACGTGTWTLEMATEFPNCEFYGIDISASYPVDIKPANTFFSQCDILNGIPFSDDHFDFIFMRQVYSCFSESDWIMVVKEINRVLKPGGYVEFREVDPVVRNTGPRTQRLFQEYAEKMKRTQGVDVSWGRQMYDYLQDYGDMIDMHRQIGTLRFGIPGTTGELVHNSFRLALQSHERFFTDQYNLEGEDYTQVVNDIINECSQLHSYINYYLCWGRKSLFDMEYDSALPSTGNSSNISLLKRKQSLQNAAGGYYKSYPSLINSLVSFSPLKNSDPGTEESSFQMFPSDSSLDVLEDTSDIDHFIEGFED